MKRCGKGLAGLVMLGCCGPAAADCLGEEGFRWLGCAPETPRLSSGWTGGTGSAPLEAGFRLAEWNGDQYASHRMRLRFDARTDTEDLLRRWRYGAGLDLQLPGAGLLQASVSTSKRRRGEGARYAFTPDGLSSRRQGEQPLWALGLSLAPADDSDGRRMLLTPQLRLDVDRWLDSHGSAELYVEYTPWIHDLKGTSREDRENLGDRLDERVPQLRMRWRF